ncbi:MAG TPA: ABC transporter permease [Thermoanaerobaculia bacterium]|nr:ABC transporter permease [Thermoanaerobaculia bacterium]
MIPIKYNVRSLFARRATTLMTVLSIAFVVLVYVGVLALAGGLRTAFAASGDPQTVLVLRDGARSETESGFASETLRLLSNLPQVARDAEGNLLASGETLHLQVLQRLDGTEANVSIRGVEEGAFHLRPQIEIVEGRRFEPGTGEIIVGANLPSRYPALSLDGRVQLGRTPFQVVGVFESGGGAYASEIWGDVRDLGDAFRRPNYYSSTRLRAASRSDVSALIDAIESDQRLRLEALPEPEYYEQQTEASAAVFIYLGNGLAILMAFGACFAAANTMYAQVSVRRKEIGTLRALGFKRRSILAAFVLEAVVLGLLAGGLGALLALPLNGFETGTVNNLTFSEITFGLRTTPGILLGGVLLATATAVIGGLPPAISASRQKITDLLRQA